jgi:deoxyribonuclease V
MILAVDVQYSKNNSIAGGVVFEHWQDERAQKEFISLIKGVAGYEPGKFFKRELPCILKLIAEHHLQPYCIVIDGFVFLDGISEAGLGKYLYDALDSNVIVIGIAKKRYKNIDSKYEIYRGSSRKPLYVTAIGIDIEQAKRNVLAMYGRFRLPTMIKRVDQICRGIRAD